MMITIAVIYCVGFVGALWLFSNCSLKSFYVDKLDKMLDYSKVLLYTVFWPIFITILIIGLRKWKK